jgi:hypothetical protein
MRFIGLLLALLGLMVSWFFGIQGTGNIGADFSTMRTRLAALFNLPGLAGPSSPTSTQATTNTPGGKTSSSGAPFNPRGNPGTI